MAMVLTDEVHQVQVEVRSAGDAVGNYAEIKLDGELAPMPFGYGRGYNVAVINDESGDVTTAKFDILNLGIFPDAFVQLVDDTPDGRIIAVAVRDDGFQNIDEAFLVRCESLGAQQIRKLQSRGSWAFLVKKGHRDILLQEAMSNTAAVSVSATVPIRRPTGGHSLTIESTGQPGHDSAASIWIDGTVVRRQTDATPGLNVVVIDPFAMKATEPRSFDIINAASQVNAFVAYLDAQPADYLVMIGVQGEVAAWLTPAAHEAFSGIGATRSRTLPTGCSYALIGRKGAMPGAIPEIVVMNAVRLTALYDAQGYWTPRPAARLVDGNNPIVILQHDLVVIGDNQPLLDLAPGTGATVKAGPGAVTLPGQNQFVLWGGSPNVSIGGRAPGGIQIWSTKDRPVRSKSALTTSFGDQICVTHLMDSFGEPIPGLGKIWQVRQMDFVAIRRFSQVAPGRHLVEIAGLEFKFGNAQRVAMQRKAATDGLEFAPKPTAGPSGLIIVEEGPGMFSLMPDDGTERWYDAVMQRLTADYTKREVFTETVRLADQGFPDDPLLPGEGVGVLEPGQLALHSGANFQGDVWVACGDVRASLIDGSVWPRPDFLRYFNDRAFLTFPNFLGTMQPVVGSVRLGPYTFARLYRGPSFTGDRLEIGADNAEVPDAWRINIGSIEVVRLAQPAGSPMTVSVQLSDDHRLNEKGEIEAFVAYRSTISVPPNVEMVEVRATDPLSLLIGAKPYSIGPDIAAVVPVNAVHKLVITIDAASLGTAGLLLRTDTMNSRESYAVHPDRALHEQLAARKDVSDADAAAFSTATGINAHGQRALGHALATIVYRDVDTVIGPCHAREISGAAMDQRAWKLTVPGRQRSDPLFAHLTTDQEIAAEISGAEDGDIDASGHRRSIGGLWDELVAGAHEVESIVVHKVVDDVHAAAHELHTVVRYVEAGESKLKSFALDTAHRAVQLAEMVVARVRAMVHTVIAVTKLAFSWPDILHTQQVIVAAVLQALDGIPSRIESIIRQANGFIDAKKADVSAALDAKIAENKTSGATNTSAIAASTQPDPKGAHRRAHEQIHWLLAKVADHHGTTTGGSVPPPSASPASFAGVLDSLSAQAAPDTPIARAVQKMNDALTSAISEPVAAPTFLMEALLEAVKAALLEALDGIELLVDHLLAAVKDAIEQFRALLVAPWDVPFVAQLYRWLVDAHGTPNPTDVPNALNVCALMAAIPATTLSLVITGKPPFPAQVPRTGPSADPAPDPDPHLHAKQGWAFASGACSLASSVLNAVLDIQKVSVPHVHGTPTVYGPGNQYWYRGKQHMVPARLNVESPAALPTVLEIFNTALAVAAQVCAWPGGMGPVDWSFPYTPSTAPAEKLPEVWENIAWITEAAALALDMVLVVALTHTRLRRAGNAGPLIATGLGVLDLGLVITTVVMGALHGSEEDKTTVLSLKASQGVFGALGGCFPWCRTTTVVSASFGASLPALSVIDLTTGLVSSGATFTMAGLGLV